MKALSNNFAVHQEQGFDVYVLSNERIELAVVPELGARIISLKNLRTGREWLWHPPGGRKLFRNRLGDDFATSPLVGVDECLPTIAPCQWQGRELPDHGEVWAAPWTINYEAWDNGVLQTSVQLKISPFEFERTIELHENEIRLSYQLHNRNNTAEHFSWAIHPLLRLQKGDQLVLPASTRALLNGATWVDDLASELPAGNCAKLFAAGITEGFAVIHNPNTEERLEFAWPSHENNTLGIWLTRGGWHGHEHFALEPTNSNADTLEAAARSDCCGTVEALNSVGWQVCLRVGA